MRPAPRAAAATLWPHLARAYLHCNTRVAVRRAVGKNSVEEAVIKATYPDGQRPKEKHVQHLIDMSKESPSDDFCGMLVPRLASDNWEVWGERAHGGEDDDRRCA